MFWDNWFKVPAITKDELQERIAEREQKIAACEQMIEDITKNYLPLRDKCIEIIRKNGLNHYPLNYVYKIAHQNGKIRFLIYDLKEDYWDGERTLKQGDDLLDETIQLNTIDLLDKLEEPSSLTFSMYTSERDKILDSMVRLGDPNDNLRSRIKYYKLGINKIQEALGESKEL